MKRSRAAYAILIVLLAWMLYQYRQPFLLWAAGILLLLALTMALLLRRDAGNLSVSLRLRGGQREGGVMAVTAEVSAKKALLVTRTVQLELERRNIMTGAVERQTFLLLVMAGKEKYDLPLQAAECGWEEYVCTYMQARDLLNILTCRLDPFRPVRTVVYPRDVELQVELQRTVARTLREEGMTQNRKGTDASETFDIREYQQGDDVRSIHWKLSSKTDSLIVRQAGAPFHYRVALLPDIGMLRAAGDETLVQERNSAIAFGAAIGQELVRQGVDFCFALPTGETMELLEVCDRRQWMRALNRWMETPLPKRGGDALEYFVAQHIELNFSRVIMLCAGEYSRHPDGYGGRTAFTVVAAVEGKKRSMTAVNERVEIITLPATPQAGEDLRILC